MIVVINASSLGVSEYDIDDVVDVASVSGALRVMGPSGEIASSALGSETFSVSFETGRLNFGAALPKRATWAYPMLSSTSGVTLAVVAEEFGEESTQEYDVPSAGSAPREYPVKLARGVEFTSAVFRFSCDQNGLNRMHRFAVAIEPARWRR